MYIPYIPQGKRAFGRQQNDRRVVATVGANEPSFSCITPNDRALIHANISQAKREAEIEAIKAKMHHISKENVRLKALVRTQKKSSKPMKNVRKQPGKTSVCRT